MKTGKYNIRDLFNNRYIEQIIVPEIQRDYVWGEEQVNGLLNSIVTDFGNYNDSELDLPETIDEELRAEFFEFHRSRAFASNIGFIYAYTDHEYAGKYFLIDGQQRVTTIYLVILALMHRNGLQKEFREFYQNENRLKLDYRVREAAHGFIEQFVKAILKGTKDVTDEVWFHRDYLHDQTIGSVIENYSVIEAFFDDFELDETVLLEYIQEHVEFWYFDTNISEQGEELYIYMNARGEQMQSNENLKADLLGALPAALKNESGVLWENWQDLFWRNRRGNENADKGFNEFLKCIAGLDNYLNGIKEFYKPEEFNDKEKGGEKNISYPHLKAALSFPRIKKYIRALEYILKHKETFGEKYAYSGWLDKCIELIWNILNSQTINWFADYMDSGRSLERNRMVFLWSVLHYIASLKTKNEDEIFRVIRFYYIRYHNNNRSVNGIRDKVKEITTDGIWGLNTLDEDSDDSSGNSLTEEQQKHQWLKSIPEEEVRDYEALIWEIEDHPHNIDGRDLSNVNSSHLVNYNGKPAMKRLKNIRTRFYELFPIKTNKTNLEKLQTLLIFYGKFWEVQSPDYYQNLCFNSWRRIVRDFDGDKKAFKTFFKLWLNEPGKSLDDWLSEVIDDDTKALGDMDLHEQLKWYAFRLKITMWERGGNIALRDWDGKDKIFKQSPKFLNTQGNMRGHGQNELSTLLPKTVKKKT
ncbi:MAG: hypothetical protein JWP78_627 [Mucilaginibacter sp.]|nr:hypothetical protein [Mucilaginibacter sp.]